VKEKQKVQFSRLNTDGLNEMVKWVKNIRT
jgi:hypothetical protein